jgi:hypothetical protein
MAALVRQMTDQHAAELARLAPAIDAALQAAYDDGAALAVALDGAAAERAEAITGARAEAAATIGALRSAMAEAFELFAETAKREREFRTHQAREMRKRLRELRRAPEERQRARTVVRQHARRPRKHHSGGD